MSKIALRTVTAADTDRCHALEMACFEPSEAASRETIQQRQEVFPEGFLVLERMAAGVDEGEVVAFLNSVASHQPDPADEDLKKLVGHDPAGAHLVILSVAVRPDLQGQGLSRPLLERFISWARAEEKETILLLCKANLIPYYQKFGFVDRGPSASTHGGYAWHEMALVL